MDTSNAAMIEWQPDASPNSRARLAGAFYLLTFLTGGVAAYTGAKIGISDEAAATATHLLAHESLFRLGFAAYIMNVVIYIPVTLLFYHLFLPVNRLLSLGAALFSLVGCAIQASGCVFQLGSLLVLGGTPYLSAFSTAQLQALALLFLKLHGQAFNLGLVFFGFYCLLIGYLILRSTFLPRILGVLMALAGLAWSVFLWPPLAKALLPYILAPGIVGEGSLTLWLLLIGLNSTRWREQAAQRRNAGSTASS